MQQSLFGWREEADYRMRVQIADQEHALKKQHAGSPDRCRPTEPRQNDFPDDGLHLEQKKGAKKYRCAVEEINHDFPRKVAQPRIFPCGSTGKGRHILLMQRGRNLQHPKDQVQSGLPISAWQSSISTPFDTLPSQSF